MDMHNDEITLQDYQNYINDITKFMATQQLETARYFSESEDEGGAYEFRSLPNEKI